MNPASHDSAKDRQLEEILHTYPMFSLAIEPAVGLSRLDRGFPAVRRSVSRSVS